jgi:isopentenyldiphosphate isomerase
MNAVQKKFFNLFWSETVCQQIFSKHRSELLENEVELIVSQETFFPQRIVLTNSQAQKVRKTAETRTENENIELVHRLQSTARKYLNDEEVEKYALSKLSRTIAKVENDISKEGGWVKLGIKIISSLDSEEDLFRLLTDYYLVPEGIRNMEHLLVYLEKKALEEFREIVRKENLYDLAISIDLISTYYNYKIKHNLLEATKHYTDTLYNDENFNSRLPLFDTLYETDVIIGGKLKGYYECVECGPNKFNGIITTDIKPSRLAFDCPSCKSNLLYMVPYEIDQGIYQNIIDKDGLLFHAIGYLLEKHNYAFVANSNYLEDVELDFVIKGNNGIITDIVEVKMFKTNRPLDTQVGNIRDAVSKIKKADTKLKTANLVPPKVQYSLVTNLTDEDVYKQALSQLKKDLIEFNINLYTIQDFYLKIVK